jgi:hypothetical protein
MCNPERQPRLLPYAEARGRIRGGDLLLFRRSGRLAGLLIGAAGRSVYCHAGMAAWWGRRLMALEMVQFRGGRAVLLSNLVARQPGRIDVYQANAAGLPFDRRRAVEQMKEFTGRDYGWRALLWCGLWHVPLVRLLLRPGDNDRANGSPPFCSMAVARAVRAGGVDPVPNLADRLTEPADLARSGFYRYRFTLE